MRGGIDGWMGKDGTDGRTEVMDYREDPGSVGSSGDDCVSL